ncbi:MAG: hypothetical protein H6741_19115 [Alphaproteobacteria bacterium]|nr:hypothetical protein [Alphaproteobacteria bacterium]MCB9794821.1 hypothetical protein [Alphaproteobacteria bacterium]
MPHQNIVLNAVQLEFSPPEFSVYTRAFKPEDDLRDLRKKHGDSWFLRREGNVLVGLPRDGLLRGDEPPSLFEAIEQRTVREASRFLRALIVDAFPNLLPRKPIGRRPFTILADDPREDRVSRAARKAGVRHRLLSGFRVMPKLSIDVKLVYLDAGPQVVLLLDFADRWEINIPLEVLAKQGVQLSSLHVVRREPEEGEHRLVGRIGCLQDGVVRLDQSFDDTKEVPSNLVYLEGRREAFTRCLVTLLGEELATKLDVAIKEECDWERTGPRFLERGGPLVGYLRGKGAIPLPGGLSVQVGQQLEMPSGGAQPAALLQTRVQYCFDPSRTKRVSDPWVGLNRWGPFRELPKREPTIQVFAPKDGLMRVEQFVSVAAHQKPRPSGELRLQRSPVNPAPNVHITTAATPRLSPTCEVRARRPPTPGAPLTQTPDSSPSPPGAPWTP